MVKIKAYSHSEICRFDIEAGTKFTQLQELVVRLFGLSKKDTMTINYCDRNGDVVSLLSDVELWTALKEQNVWKLQILVQGKEEVHHQPTPWWDWSLYSMHIVTCTPSQ